MVWSDLICERVFVLQSLQEYCVVEVSSTQVYPQKMRSERVLKNFVFLYVVLFEVW